MLPKLEDARRMIESRDRPFFNQTVTTNLLHTNGSVIFESHNSAFYRLNARTTNDNMPFRVSFNSTQLHIKQSFTFSRLTC